MPEHVDQTDREKELAELYQQKQEAEEKIEKLKKSVFWHTVETVYRVYVKPAELIYLLIESLWRSLWRAIFSAARFVGRTIAATRSLVYTVEFLVATLFWLTIIYIAISLYNGSFVIGF